MCRATPERRPPGPANPPVSIAARGCRVGGRGSDGLPGVTAGGGGPRIAVLRCFQILAVNGTLGWVTPASASNLFASLPARNIRAIASGGILTNKGDACEFSPERY
jgi:hypothetical protein